MGVKRNGRYCLDPYTMLGKADLEAFHNGIMYCIEVKSANGCWSENQQYYKEVFHKPPDRIYLLAYSVDDVMEIIK